MYYGHTNPHNSPTGFSTLIAEFYASARQNGFRDASLTDTWVDNLAVQQGVRDIEALIRHYSDRTTEFKFYIAQGPDYVDFVALEENDVIYINQGVDPAGNPITKPPEPLVALYPKEGTFIHGHPLGIVNADWVTTEQHDAAEIFTDYVLTPAEQQFIMSKGFRPAIQSVPLSFPIDLANGVAPDAPATLLNLPDDSTLLAIKDSWQYVKKQADVLLLIDTSGSMNEENKLGSAKAAALAFLDRMKNDPMQHDNRVGLTIFADDVRPLVPLDSLETNEATLRSQIEGLAANGSTALFDSVIEGLNVMGDCKDRIRAIILLSDGADTASSRTLRAALDAIGASQETACPVIVIPVAYGRDADADSLRSIGRSAKTGVVIGDPNNIQSTLEIIRAYF